MAYVDQKMSGGKIVAIVIVALIHAALGYAFVTGLAYQYVKKAQEKLNTFDVEPPPPTTVVVPPPLVVTPQPAPPVTTSQIIPKFQPTAPPAPPAPPAPAAPPAPVVSQGAVAKGNPISWYSNDDYPPSALREEAQGRTSIKVTIGVDGRVSGCTVTSSSGNTALDNQTCAVAKRRGRYSAAKDTNGNPMVATSSFSVTWKVPPQ